MGGTPSTKRSYRSLLASKPFSQDLESLLLSQTVKTMSGMHVTTIGQEFAFLRRARTLTRLEASNQSGIPNFQLKIIENESPGTAKVSFHCYLKYAAFLGVRTTDVLNNLARSHMLPSSEERLIQQVTEAAKDLQLHNESVTQRAICKLVHLSKSRLNKSPNVKMQIAEEVCKIREEQKRLHATKIFERIQNAIVHSEASGERVTCDAISEITHMPSSTFKKYVEIRELLKHKVSHKQISFQESELLAKVEYAVLQLEKRQLAVTQLAVIGIVKVDRQILVSFPRIKAFLDMKISQYHGLASNIRNSHQLEEALLIKVKASLPEIEALGQRVTLCAIGKILKVQPQQLKRYPRVWTIVDQYLHLPSSQKYLCEDVALLADVTGAIRQLEDLDLPVTYASVSELLGTYPSKFRDYPQTRALLEQYVWQSHRYRVLQNQAREKELIVQVERAIGYLNILGHPISLRGISTFIGVSLKCLRTYPQAYRILKQGVEAYRESTKAKILPVEELVLRVEEAKTTMRSRGETVTRESISVTVGMNVTTLMRYPLMREILKPAKLWKEALLLRAEEAIRRLKTSGQFVTQEKLARELKMSPSTLCTHSEIKLLLRTFEVDKQKVQAERFAYRENELVLLVSMAVQRLHLIGQPISARAVAKAIGMSSPGLKYYPKVKEVLESAIENLRNEQSL